jgi:hypothetical protein
VPTSALPDVKQIALGTIKTMAEAVLISTLAETVATVASTISNLRTA